MPRQYVRKAPNRIQVSEEQIFAAKKLIAEGKSIRFAAAANGIKEANLRKRLKTNSVPTSLGRFKPTFTKDQEAQFAVQCQNMNSIFLGITTKHIRRLAYEFAEANNIEHRFDNTSKMAGKDWVEGFLRRNDYMNFRQSAHGYIQVVTFYKMLKDLYEEYNFRPNRIYNMDEICLSSFAENTSELVKGKKVVGGAESSERGSVVTAMICMSAAGHFVAPAFIYPLNEPRPELLNGGPTQSICMMSDNGLTNTTHFLCWLNHFKDFAHPSREDPVLLIIDNHSCHVSLAGTKYARENNIVVLTLPSHASQKIQPLDVAVNNHLKNYYAKECEKWMNENPDQEINLYQVASLFNSAYNNVALMYFAESGFQETGVYPFADDLFDEVDF